MTKDCVQIKTEINEIVVATEEVQRSRVSKKQNKKHKYLQACAEKNYKTLNCTLGDLKKKIESLNMSLGDFETSKRRISSENGDHLSQLQELAATASLMAQEKTALKDTLEEQRIVVDRITKERASLLSKFLNLEHTAEGLKDNFEEETASKDNLANQLIKATNEAEMWKKKYDVDGIAKAEELEAGKVKLQARLSESQMRVEQVSFRD